jgi:aspartyl-tRNA(Asn)/glutamyl-tRNA(Gln) amidotransferase subunit C
MVSPEDVQKLAALARIEVSQAELPKFTAEFEAILAYVGQLDSLSLPKELKDAKPALRNVFRKDENATPGGTWTEKLASAFPEREGNSLVVKQIITHD